MILSCLYCSETGEELLICSVMENAWDPNALSRPSIFEVETGSKTGKKKKQARSLLMTAKLP